MSIVFPLSVVDGIMGGLAFMYEFMHVWKNVCISLILCIYIYVGVHVGIVYCVIISSERRSPLACSERGLTTLSFHQETIEIFISRALYKALGLSNG